MKKILIAVFAVFALTSVTASAVTFVDLNLSAFHKPVQFTIGPGQCEGNCTSTIVTRIDARNLGLGLEFQTEDRVATALVGFNLGNWNEYVAAEFAPIQFGDRDSNFSAGVVGAVAHTDSIGNYPTGGIFASLNRNKYGVNLIATPTVNNVPAFVGVQLRYRLGDEPKPVAVVFTPAPKPTPYVAPAPVVVPPKATVEEVIIKHGRE